MLQVGDRVKLVKNWQHIHDENGCRGMGVWTRHELANYPLTEEGEYEVTAVSANGNIHLCYEEPHGIGYILFHEHFVKVESND